MPMWHQRKTRAGSHTTSRTKSSCVLAAASTASARQGSTSSRIAPATKKSGQWTTTERASTRLRIWVRFPFPRVSRRTTRASLSRLWARMAGRSVCIRWSWDAWSTDGGKVAFSSSQTGDNEIYTTDASGGGLHRVTAFRGPDVSPVWNPKSNAQIAWVSGRSGLPQIYIMDSDGANVQRMTDGGYAISPSWSPNGQFLAFSWNRKYGPGAPGGQDIYIMDIASKRWIQLTHEAGSNDFPSWSPDGRHIVFQRQDSGRAEIWSMLADGTEQQQLTHEGWNAMPNWSWK